MVTANSLCMCSDKLTLVCGSHMNYRDPLITLSYHTAKFNVGDKGNQTQIKGFVICFMLIVEIVEHHQDLINIWIRSRLKTSACPLAAQ